MEGLMMHYPLTTNAILEYGNQVFRNRKIISYLPDGTRHEYTIGDMYLRSKQLAHALTHQLGLRKGDMVGTFAWNHGPHVELYYGISGIGAVCHTINIRLSSEQTEFIINNSEDKVIFVDATLVPLLERIAPLLETVKHYILIHAPEGFRTSLPNTLHYEDLISGGATDFDWPELDENEACGMCYTSGTTGLPKGVLYSHRSTYLHASALLSPNAANASCRDTLLLVVPQFHVMAWGSPFMCVMAGANMVMPSSNLQPEALLRIMEAEGVNKANGVPSIWIGIYEALKKNPPSEKFKLKEFIVGGAAMPASLIDGFQRDFGIQGYHAWGMTETSPLGTLSRLQPQHDTLPGAEQLRIKAKQGIPLPGVEIRIAREDGSIAPWDGQTMGELQIRGAWIAGAYFKTDNRDNFTEDGWFRTGDVSTMDAEGYMQITDRTKDLIKSGGEWISSVALESALMSHPGIREASVIAIPDEKWSERPLACLVSNKGEKPPTPAQLQEFLARSFAKYQVPDRYAFLEEIPKTSVGKFDKKELRRRFAAGEITEI